MDTEAVAFRYVADGFSNILVHMMQTWSFNFQIALAKIVNLMVIHHEITITIFLLFGCGEYEIVGGEWRNYIVTNNIILYELFFTVILSEFLHYQGSESGASSAIGCKVAGYALEIITIFSMVSEELFKYFKFISCCTGCFQVISTLVFE